MSSGKKSRGQPSDETLGDLYNLARTQVEKRQPPLSRKRWNALIVIAILSCLVLSMLALRWYRSASQSSLNAENLAFLQSASRSAARFPLNSPALATLEPSPTALPPTPVVVTGPSGISGIDPKVFIPMVWSGPGGCKTAEEIDFELVSGPVLNPDLGTRLETLAPPDAVATWTVRNLSTCQWDSLGIYSIYRSLLHQPEIRRGGDLFDPVAGLVVANPGETLEISAAFPGEQASEVSDEWVLVINGHQLFSKSHLLLDVDEWLVVENPEPKNTGAGSTGTSSGQTNPVTQPKRPTDSAPARP
jgi:hypothetical protein